jgi:hypothetical protein
MLAIILFRLFCFPVSSENINITIHIIKILPLSFLCEIWSLAFEEEHRLIICIPRQIIRKINFRRMRLAKHIARIEENVYTILAANLMKRGHIEDLCIDGRIPLSHI